MNERADAKRRSESVEKTNGHEPPGKGRERRGPSTSPPTSHAGIGVFLALAGLSLALFASFLLARALIASSLFLIEPELVFLPSLFLASIALVMSSIGIFLARRLRGRRRRGLVGLIFLPTLIMWLLPVWGAIVTLGRPLYLSSSTEVMEVRWRLHPQLSSYATFSADWTEPNQQSFREQPGLIEHLKAQGDRPLALTMEVYYDRDGLPVLLRLREIEGFELARQFIRPPDGFELERPGKSTTKRSRP